MDVVERYQFYLNKLLNFKETSMASELFYNCALPSFGPKCRYKSHHSSLNAIIGCVMWFSFLYLHIPTCIHTHTDIHNDTSRIYRDSRLYQYEDRYTWMS